MKNYTNLPKSPAISKRYTPAINMTITKNSAITSRVKTLAKITQKQLRKPQGGDRIY